MSWYTRRALRNLNIPLAQRVLDHLIANPNQHNQCSWGRRDAECGTKGCLAGWAVMLDPSRRFAFEFYRGVLIVPECGTSTTNPGVREAAQKLLGLDWKTANFLFGAGPNKYAIEEMEELIKAARKVQWFRMWRQEKAAQRAARKEARVAAKAEEARQRQIDQEARQQARLARKALEYNQSQVKEPTEVA